jgi:hypothetical protein
MSVDYRYVLLYYILLGFIISLVTLLIRSKSFEPIKILILTIIIALILYIVDLSTNYTYINNTYNLGLSNM